MKTLLSRAGFFLRSEDGPAATEYAVLLALIILVALGPITTLGLNIASIFQNVSDSLPNNVAGE